MACKCLSQQLWDPMNALGHSCNANVPVSIGIQKSHKLLSRLECGLSCLGLSSQILLRMHKS